MSEWHKTSWGEVAALEYGKALREYRSDLGEVRVYGTNGPVGWTNVRQAEGPGVIIGRKGAYRGVHYSIDDFWVIDTAYYLRPLGSMNLRWAYYALVDVDINSMDSGSAIPSTSRADFYSLPVAVPPPHEQDAIAEVLGALDDKIAINERIETAALELAMAVYSRESSSAEWRRITLGEAARWYSGGTPRTSVPEYWGGTIPWISASSLKTPWIRDSDRRVTELGAENGTRIAARHTILFVVRGMSLMTEFRVGITQREVAFGQDCKALVAAPGVNPATLFLAVKSKEKEILGMVDLAGHGTGRLVTDRLASISIGLPRGEVAASAFSKLTNPLIERASIVGLENQTLAALRDTLLPQLMSGRLRVKDAEKIVEDHT
ncbi:restriction endonuclease subunit S [Streptomyces anulatus]|uniref:restriction endonuclease subunit S n=1 Tax=Streptomyces anulatus TaxID=1892 RepID=UPI003323EBFF